MRHSNFKFRFFRLLLNHLSPGLLFLLLILLMIVNTTLLSQSKSELYKQFNNADNDSLEALACRNLGAYYMDKDLDSALLLYQKALDLFDNFNNYDSRYFKVQCITQMAVIYTMQGEYTSALKNNQQALDILEVLVNKIPDDIQYKEGIGVTLANTGAIHYHQENLKKALEYWKSAAEIYEEVDNHYAVAMLLNNIGIIYSELNNFNNSLKYYHQALDFFKKDSAIEETAMCYTNIGELYSNNGSYIKATEYLRKSLAIKKKIEDLPGLAICYLEIGELYFAEGNFKKSVENTMKCLEIAKKISATREEKDAYELLAKNYAEINDFQNAYKYHLLYKEISDSIFSSEKHQQFLEIEAKYENEKKENELRIMKQKEANQKRVSRILLAGIVVVAFISIFWIRSVIQKRRKEKKLYEVDRKLAEKHNELMQKEIEKKEMIAHELNREIEFKTKELTTTTLNMMQKNKMLIELDKSIDVIAQKSDTAIIPDLNGLKNQVKQNLRTEKDWEAFKLYFEQVNKDFFDKLNSIDSSLNIHELRHCALIKLNLNIKETASVLNLSPNSIKSARYRLKKKLGLEPEQDLGDYIRNL